jgi:peptidyl-prolyl cis-trans isomerase B (cyclophilin B)
MLFRLLDSWLLASACALGAGAISARQSSDPVVLEWKGTVHRLGAPVPVEMKTRVEALSTKLQASAIVVKGSDGKERRLRSSAKQTKPRIDSGQWIVEVDVSELVDSAPAGKFEVAFELEEGQRSKRLFGTFVQPVADPKTQLSKKPDGLAALIETDAGNILVALDGTKAPKTVANFVKLIADGFYDGKTFHRILRGRVIQGGAFKPDGSSSDSDKIPFEISAIPHDRGVISMARLPNDKDSATCQFFLCLTPHRNEFDGNYASFGKVVEGCGYEAMDRIALTPVDYGAGNEKSKPKEPVVIRKVTIVEKP